MGGSWGRGGVREEKDGGEKGEKGEGREGGGWRGRGRRNRRVGRRRMCIYTWV
jgi:hypothetical protein